MNYSFKTALNKSDRGGWVRLLTLTYLRWIAIIGQTFAVIIGFYFLKLDFSIFSCLYLILLSSIFAVKFFISSIIQHFPLGLYLQVFEPPLQIPLAIVAELLYKNH